MSNDQEFGYDVVWQQTMDQGAFTLRVTRADEDTALLQVINNSNDDVILSRDRMPLAYGARFGPDVDDVAEWQAIALEAVDDWLVDHAIDQMKEEKEQ